jgi:hypothetical protein
MSKLLYWSEVIDEEHVFPMSRFLIEMKEQGIKELKVFKVKPEIIPDVFYCHYVDEFCMKSDEPCGKTCEEYSPRNGKNGRCRHHDVWSHEPTDEFIILKLNP